MFVYRTLTVTFALHIQSHCRACVAVPLDAIVNF